MVIGGIQGENVPLPVYFLPRCCFTSRMVAAFLAIALDVFAKYMHTKCTDGGDGTGVSIGFGNPNNNSIYVWGKWFKLNCKSG